MKYKYIVIPPKEYKAKHRESFEFESHKDAVICALAVSKACRKGVEIQRFPIPYKSKEVVLNF